MSNHDAAKAPPAVPERTMNDDLAAVAQAEDFYNAMGLAGWTRETVIDLAQARKAGDKFGALPNRVKASLVKTFMLCQDVHKVRAAQAAAKALERRAAEVQAPKVAAPEVTAEPVNDNPLDSPNPEQHEV